MVLSVNATDAVSFLLAVINELSDEFGGGNGFNDLVIIAISSTPNVVW